MEGNPYYVPPPDQAPNIYAEALGTYLQVRAPYAQQVWQQRLMVMDPTRRYQALADLADIQARAYDSMTKAWAAQKTGMSQVQSELVRYELGVLQDRTKRAEINTDRYVAESRQYTAEREAEAIASEKGMKLSVEIDAVTDAYRQDLMRIRSITDSVRQEQELDAAKHQWEIGMADVNARMLQEVDPGEERALRRKMWSQVHGLGRFVSTQSGGGDRGAEAAMDLVGNFAHVNLGSPTPGATAPQGGGAGAPPMGAIRRATADMAARLGYSGGGPGGGTTGSVDSALGPSTVVPGSTPPSRVSVTQSRSGVPGASGMGPIDGSYASTLGAVDQARDELMRDPYERLGWFGEPIPIPQAVAQRQATEDARERAFAWKRAQEKRARRGGARAPGRRDPGPSGAPPLVGSPRVPAPVPATPGAFPVPLDQIPLSDRLPFNRELGHPAPAPVRAAPPVRDPAMLQPEDVMYFEKGQPWAGAAAAWEEEVKRRQQAGR